MAENVGQRLLNGAVNRQIGRLSGLTERLRNRGLDHHSGMGLAPQPHQSADRFAKTKLRKSDRPQPLENPPVELLQGIDLFQDGVAMLSQPLGARLAHVRKAHQRADMGPQREKIRPKFVVQLAGDFLALGVL